VIVLLVSLAWTVLAQVQMGQSWCIGIDTQHRTALVILGFLASPETQTFWE
jgi:hypothetical protein